MAEDRLKFYRCPAAPGLYPNAWPRRLMNCHFLPHHGVWQSVAARNGASWRLPRRYVTMLFWSLGYSKPFNFIHLHRYRAVITAIGCVPAVTVTVALGVSTPELMVYCETVPPP